MSSAFDTFSNDGEEASTRGSSTRPFDDDGYIGYDPRLPSQCYEGYGEFAHDETSIPPSPKNYGFRSDPYPEYSFGASPFVLPEANEKVHAEMDDDRIFVYDGPIQPPLSEMQPEEGFVLREWHRSIVCGRR